MTPCVPRWVCRDPLPGRGRRRAGRMEEVTSRAGRAPGHLGCRRGSERLGLAASEERWRATAGSRGPWGCCAPSTRRSSRAGRKSAPAGSGRCTRCAMSTGRRGSPSSCRRREVCTSTTGERPRQGRCGAGDGAGLGSGCWGPGGPLLPTCVAYEAAPEGEPSARRGHEAPSGVRSACRSNLRALGRSGSSCARWVSELRRLVAASVGRVCPRRC